MCQSVYLYYLGTMELMWKFFKDERIVGVDDIVRLLSI